MALLKRALTDSRGLGDQHIHMDDDKLRIVAEFASGDARSALSTLEMVVLNGDAREDGIYVTEETLKECTSQKSFLYDKSGEEHYNLISALHKSMRNSDPDAAVYWLARMLEAGRILYTLPAALFALPVRMSGLLTPGPLKWPLLPMRPVISSGCLSAPSTWPCGHLYGYVP